MARSLDAMTPWNSAASAADALPAQLGGPAEVLGSQDGARPTPGVRPGSWAAWRIALRPRTFWIAAIPVVVSTTLAWRETGAVELSVAVLALIASLLLQAITNLQNDVGYATRGGDGRGHVGLSRASTNGWLRPAQIRAAIAVFVVLTLAVGLPLIVRGGWPAAVMGACSIAAAIAYMGGPKPIAFTPLGEFTVFVFFGLVAVLGSYYVQTGTVSVGAVAAAIAVGALASGVLAVNNHRDAVHDAATGRRTFVVVFGRATSERLFGGLLLVAFLLAPVLVLVERSAWFALPSFVLPTAIVLWKDFCATEPGPAWNSILFRTVTLELSFGVLLAAAALLAGHA